ncbi:MAG: hypothetical protein LBS19_05570 [Clostridiales bacterium]|nr:hypothetical protein [Clostridiales bacterium]
MKNGYSEREFLNVREFAELVELPVTTLRYDNKLGLLLPTKRGSEDNGYVFDSHVYNIYLLDELCVIDPNQYLLQVSAAVKETRRSPSQRL